MSAAHLGIEVKGEDGQVRTPSDISENIGRVRREIAAHAALVGRNPNDVTVVAVTKTYEPRLINEVIQSGITDIGENRVQEILEKYDDVLPVNWHMIGHLQRNKVKSIINKVKMIHSVDSFRLAEEINLRAGEVGTVMDILIQVNTAEEESKFGINSDALRDLFLDVLEKCEYIRIRGLMCMAPFAEDPEDVRLYFRETKTQFDSLRAIVHERLELQFLSMGMSGDFGVAIEEGSNIVRIGTAIFGGKR